jgi:hypothetical protein
MFRVESSIQIPEDYSQDRAFEFTFTDKKEFNVTFDIEVKTFMPVFEGGILLPEIEQMTRNSNVNPNNEGIGMFRNGKLYFGGVLQEFNYGVNDMRFAPIQNILSNKGLPETPTTENGGLFFTNEITSAAPEVESPESKQFRNE